MNTNRLLYIDAQSGISGDMMIGALLDLGGSLELLNEKLRSLKLRGYVLSARKVLRAGIHSTKFDVATLPAQAGDEASDAHDGHGHAHDHRGFREIRAMIEASSLSEWVKEKSVAVFSRLADNMDMVRH